MWETAWFIECTYLGHHLDFCVCQTCKQSTLCLQSKISHRCCVNTVIHFQMRQLLCMKLYLGLSYPSSLLSSLLKPDPKPRSKIRVFQIEILSLYINNKAKFFCFITRGPQALTVTWISQTLHWLQRGWNLYINSPMNKWKSTMV